MSKKAYEGKLAALEDLRREGATPATVEALRKALRDRSNYAVSKAAAIAGDLGLNALIPELLAAFHKFLENPVKTDPQCWAKNALSKALAGLGHDEPEAFLLGLAHMQMEPVWGGQQDTAATLRGTCALALVQCRNLSDLELLSRLTEVLADSDKTVRIEAARAIGHLGRAEGALLLRLRALVGDSEPDAIGACFSALFAIEGRAAIPFMARFLDAGDERSEEAATALGLTRETEAFEILKRRWDREKHGLFAAVLVSAIGLLRMPEAVDFLIQIVLNESSGAEAAIQALAGAHLSEDARALIEAAVTKSGNPRLAIAFEKHFGG